MPNMEITTIQFSVTPRYYIPHALCMQWLVSMIPHRRLDHLRTTTPPIHTKSRRQKTKFYGQHIETQFQVYVGLFLRRRRRGGRVGYYFGYCHLGLYFRRQRRAEQVG